MILGYVRTSNQRGMHMTEQAVIELPVDEILARFDHGDRWIQSNWSTDEGECLHNGIRACMPRKGDGFLIQQVATVHGWGTQWNDEEGRTFDDIKQTLVEHREVFPDEMLATYGPQWEPIAVLVRRIAELTGPESKRLNAERDAAWEPDRVAAWGVARDSRHASAWEAAMCAARGAAHRADREATLDAATDAAGDAARNATGADWEAAVCAAWGATTTCHAAGAAGDAAAALSARDLIGQGGFTKTHYNMLIGPWATVIGIAHPDDIAFVGPDHEVQIVVDNNTESAALRYDKAMRVPHLDNWPTEDTEQND